MGKRTLRIESERRAADWGLLLLMTRLSTAVVRIETVRHV